MGFAKGLDRQNGLGFLQPVTRQGMVRVNGQHRPPCSGGGLMVALRVVNGRQMEPSLKVVTTAADGGLEIGRGLFVPLPLQV